MPSTPTLNLRGGRFSSNSTHRIETILQEALLNYNKSRQRSHSSSWASMVQVRNESTTDNTQRPPNVAPLLLTRDVSVSISETNCAVDSDHRSRRYSAQNSQETQSELPRHTKIVCAIGPSCRDVTVLVHMLDAGMNVARLNFSHETIDYHTQSIHNVRAALALRPQKRCAILMDTKGAEIRTGTLINGAPVLLKAQQYLVLTTDQSYSAGHGKCISCTYQGLAESTYPGALLLCADGSISFEVLYCALNGGAVPEKYQKSLAPHIGTLPTSVPYIVVQVKSDGLLRERQNMCLPGVEIPSNMLPSLTEKDISDLMNFAYQQQVDIVSCSLVRNAQDVRNVRNCLKEAQQAYLRQQKQEQENEKATTGGTTAGTTAQTSTKTIRVHAKIESLQALQNIDEIIQEADGVHVSRGDLGMALPLYKVFLAQKMIITKARRYGKPVVTSTEMLDSMITNVRPSHAECTDVANAVLDGTDAMMLSGEVAKGKYPIRSVLMMARIAKAAESCVDYHDEFLSMRQLSLNGCGGSGGDGGVENNHSSPANDRRSRSEVIAASAVDTSFKLGAKLIVVFTTYGNMPMQVAKYRPGIPIVALACHGSQVDANEGLLNQLDSLSRGVHGWAYCARKEPTVNLEQKGTEPRIEREDNTDHLHSMLALKETMEKAAGLGWITRGDAVVSLWSRNEKKEAEKNNIEDSTERRQPVRSVIGSSEKRTNCTEQDRLAREAVKYVQSVNYYGY